MKLLQAVFTLCLSQSYMPSSTPPKAKKVEHYNIYHGTKFLDEYNWLRDNTRKDKEVLEYLKLENDYSFELLEPLKNLTSNLFDEMVSRIVEDDISYPIAKGIYKYYSRTVKGLQYPIFCRIKSSEKIEGLFNEEQLLDLNEFKEKHLKLGTFQVSPDEKKIGYTLDTIGNEKYTFFAKNTESGEVFEELKLVEDKIIWSQDSSSFFYLVSDEIARPYKLFKHKLGDIQENDELLYEEKDLKFDLYITQSVSKRFLFLETKSHTSTEVHFLDLLEPGSKLICFSPRLEDRIYSLEHQEDNFIILTNLFKDEKYINFFALTTRIPSDFSSEASWKKLLPYNENHYITAIYCLREYVILEERIDGYTNIRIVNFSTNYLIKFPEAIYVSMIKKSYQTYNSSQLIYHFSSPTTPLSLIRYDLNKNVQNILKVSPVLGNFNSNLYHSERLVTLEKIPISIVYRKDSFKKDGTNPLHLRGYGSYGNNIEPGFKRNQISLLDRGFICAIAHVRGGSELGRQWYEVEGKLLNKKNTFNDFISVANYLINNKFTSPKLLSIEGRSAGGLLVGAAINSNTSLFNAAILGVPFVDIINTMMDDSLPLTIAEYEEWGNPNLKVYFDYMKSYSPYDNLPLKVSDFPHILVRSSFNDYRVNYWEPTKYVAKIRDILNSSSLSHQRKVVHLIKMKSGHFGASGRYRAYNDEAQDYSFLIATAFNLSPYN